MVCFQVRRPTMSGRKQAFFDIEYHQWTRHQYGDHSWPVVQQTLYAGDSLEAGQSMHSENGRWQLVMQADGNLVLYDGSSRAPSAAVWASNTQGKGRYPHTLCMQADGNAVVYDDNRKPTWATDTFGTRGQRLTLQNDRNLVLYDCAGKALWQSENPCDRRTSCCDQTPPRIKHTMHAGDNLEAGQSLQSENGRYQLVMQEDGNLVLYDGPSRHPSAAVWASNTNGKGRAPHRLCMQADGNAVVYDACHVPTWASDTFGTHGERLTLQNDRNLALYDCAGKALWLSNTWQAENPMGCDH